MRRGWSERGAISSKIIPTSTKKVSTYPEGKSKQRLKGTGERKIAETEAALSRQHKDHQVVNIITSGGTNTKKKK